MQRILTLIVSIIVCRMAFCSTSADTATVKVYSHAMHSTVPALVILPADYAPDTRSYPVTYLLHGHGGHSHKWLDINPDLPQMATELQMIVVCPSVGNSWYFDSPADSTLRYETYMTRELPAYIDSAYSTIATPQGRALSGFSMGGHGAMWLAIRHPEIFSICGSMSGGVDFRAFPGSWNLKDILGERDANPDVWDSHTVISLVDSIPATGLDIIFDCGTEDFFLDCNERLHAELLRRNIPHTYITRPGAHNIAYWQVSLPIHLRHFASRFSSH